MTFTFEILPISPEQNAELNARVLARLLNNEGCHLRKSLDRITDGRDKPAITDHGLPGVRTKERAGNN